MLNLRNEFYDLITEGYIYEEENGKNMSYGEYVAISDYLWEMVDHELMYCNDIVEKIETYISILKTVDDDTAMFMGINDDMLSVSLDIDEYENTIDYCGIPECFLDELNEYVVERELEYVA